MKKDESDRVKNGASAYLSLFRKELWENNPVLFRALALAPVLAVSVSLKNGLLLAGVTFVLLTVMGIFSPLAYSRLPAPLRPAVTALAAAAAVTPFCLLSQRFFPNVASSVGIFLPLAAVNGIIFYRAEAFGSKNKILPSLIDGAANGLGFAAVIVFLSAVREILGAGTLYEKRLPGFTGYSFNFALLPSGAFLLLACVFALAQHYRMKKPSEETKDER